jgi:hypothetical protein
MKLNKEISILQEGCVYYFFNDHIKRKKMKKPIHKISKKTFYLVNELTNIKNIKENKSNFYVCENSSELKIMEIEEEMHQIESANELKTDNTILLKFEDRELIYFKNYLKALSPSKKYILSIINFYKHLLQSIHLLVDNKIVHNHINFDSVVIDNHDRPLISNFSFSINISREDVHEYIKHFIIAYEPSYLEWPIEFHILSYLLTNKLNSLSSYNIQNIVCNVIENHNILKTFGESVVSSYKEEALNYFKKYVNCSYEYILTDILQYYNTWDNYALSIMFLRILIGLHRTIGIQNKFIIFFMKLLVTNIHFNPLKRLSIGSTIHNFESIIDDLQPNDYKEILHHLVSA